MRPCSDCCTGRCGKERPGARWRWSASSLRGGWERCATRCAGRPATSNVGSRKASTMRNASRVRLQCSAMPNYRVFRMKDSPRQQFRWAPHVSGPANAKPKDFEPSGEVEALHEYDAWRILREAGTPLGVGDLLESADGQLRICKYVGFEPAQWVLPEPKVQIPVEAASASPSVST